MARPPPIPLQRDVAAAVRGAQQGGASIARIKILKSAGGDLEIELETTLAPQPAIEEPAPIDELTPLQRRLAEHAQKIR